MTTAIQTIDTQTSGMIHDCQFDYYSRKLAMCSSDHTITIYDVHGENYHRAAVLQEHTGPVWQVDWAHPRFGVVLASCSYDGTAIIWRETSPNHWERIWVHQAPAPSCSVNSVSWAPSEEDLVLGIASSSGEVTVLSHKPSGDWAASTFEASKLGVNALSWAPSSSSPYRLATGACDNEVRVWVWDGAEGWREDTVVRTDGNESVHRDWVRDVAFSPLGSGSSPHPLLASCGEDRCVYVWHFEEESHSQQGEEGEEAAVHGRWVPTLVQRFNTPVWRVSWSLSGFVLAVSCGDQSVSMWKRDVDGHWVEVTELEDNPVSGLVEVKEST